VVSSYADQIVFLDQDSRSVVAGKPADVFAHPAFEARYGRVVNGEGGSEHDS